jgi:hypothetical protein
VLQAILAHKIVCVNKVFSKKIPCRLVQGFGPL